MVKALPEAADRQWVFTQQEIHDANRFEILSHVANTRPETKVRHDLAPSVCAERPEVYFRGEGKLNGHVGEGELTGIPLNRPKILVSTLWTKDSTF